jgi:hypothetical protein
VILAAFLVATLAGDTTASALEYRGDAGRLRVPLPRLDATLTVDGALDEPVWGHAVRLTGFSQYAPVDGRPAQNGTEVLVWYSPTSIAFGIRAKAAPGSIRATLAQRDRIGEEDLIEIFLGTFGDGRQAMVFGVNPLGVQMDGVLLEGRNMDGGPGGGGGGGGGGRGRVDTSPDFVFTSKGRVTEEGYEIEVLIPVKTLRYQPGDPQNWGLHVIRRVQSTGHEESWVPARRASTTFLGQSGTLQGLTGLRRGLVMDLNPALTSSAAGSRADDGSWTYQSSVDLGGNLRWGITPNLTLNGTANPDFSQVESDATQVVEDPRRALFFPEKRPFFLEGVELFSTPNQLVYTRRIGAPVVAAKLTGKLAATSMGLLLAVDGQETSASREDHPFVGIVRLQHDLGRESKLGMVYTDRTEGAASNRVGGVDTRLVFGGLYTLTAQAAASLTSDGERTIGAPLWDLAFSRTGRRFGFNYAFEGISDEFVAGTGFISRRGIASASANHSLTFYGGRDALLERTSVSAWVRGQWAYDDFVSGRGLQDRQLFLSGNLTLRGGWRLGATAIVESSGYDEALYANYALERRTPAGVDTIPFPAAGSIQNRDLRLNIDSPRLGGGFSFRANLTVGRDVNFHEWAPADIVHLNGGVQYRPTNQLRFDGSYVLQSYRRRTDGSLVSITHVPRLRVEYQISRAVFLRLVGEYSASARDSLRDDSRTGAPILLRSGEDEPYERDRALSRATNRIRSEFLFSVQPTPGTVFFAGYSGAYSDAERFRFRGVERTVDGFFVKASYLFRM